MFKKLSTSYNLVKVSFGYIKRDGELLVYSILSLLASLTILITFVGVDWYFFGFINSLTTQGGAQGVAAEWIGYLMLFLYYLVFSFVTFFFNTAIITSVQRRIEGKENKLGDGLRDATKHLKEIFIWSIINALVTTILKILQEKFGENSLIGKIIIGIVGGMWNILTFFSFPLMILNGKGAKDAINESGSLFKKTWGERAIIHVGIGLLFFFFYLAIIILGIFIIFTGYIITGILFIFLGIIFLAILGSTCDTIIKTILLYYAQNGKMPDGLENADTIINIAGEK